MEQTPKLCVFFEKIKQNLVLEPKNGRHQFLTRTRFENPGLNSGDAHLLVPEKKGFFLLYSTIFFNFFSLKQAFGNNFVSTNYFFR